MDADTDPICKCCEQEFFVRPNQEPTPYCDQCAHELVGELLSALDQIVTDWHKVDPDVQVPDEINVNEHWDAAIAAISKARGED